MTVHSVESSEVAVLGAGPVGIEAALHARRRGWDVQVYERDEPGAHVDRWSHVEFFSPWRLERSDWGENVVEAAGGILAPDDAYPTGAEYLEKYLRPLARSELLSGRVATDCEVLGVSRAGALKTDHIGSDERSRTPFVLRLDDGGEECFAEAEVVIDATGAYRTPNGLGPGGLRAAGELDHQDRIEYYIPDVLGADRETYADRRTLVVGAGYSAVTTLRNLQRLRAECRGTEVAWLRREESEPYPLIPDDPLPMRRELSEFGNAVARGEIAEIEVIEGTIRRIESGEERPLSLQISRNDSSVHSSVHSAWDQIVATVGYRPDLTPLRELQIHECWATEGPINLAAALLASESDDCLDRETGGVELLEHPEPNFYMLGSKSYGRNSAFLLKDGFEQIRQVFDSLESRG